MIKYAAIVIFFLLLHVFYPEGTVAAITCVAYERNIYPGLKEVSLHMKKDAVIVPEKGYYRVRVSMSSEKPGTGVPSESVRLIRPDSLDLFSFFRRFCVNPDLFNSNRVFSGALDTIKKSASSVRKIFLIKGDSPWLKRINYFNKSVAFVNILIVTIVISVTIMFILLFIYQLINKHLPSVFV